MFNETQKLSTVAGSRLVESTPEEQKQSARIHTQEVIAKHEARRNFVALESICGNNSRATFWGEAAGSHRISCIESPWKALLKFYAAYIVLQLLS